MNSICVDAGADMVLDNGVIFPQDGFGVPFPLVQCICAGMIQNNMVEDDVSILTKSMAKTLHGTMNREQMTTRVRASTYDPNIVLSQFANVLDELVELCLDSLNSILEM